MAKIIADLKNGVQIEEAPNSLRTMASYVDVSLYGLTASGVGLMDKCSSFSDTCLFLMKLQNSAIRPKIFSR